MTDISNIRRIAVVGSGIMGTGIASVALLGGYERVVLNDIDSNALMKSQDSIESVIKALESEDKFKEYISSRPFLRNLNGTDFMELNFKELKANRKAVGVIADGCTAGEIMDRLVCEADFQRAVSDVDFVIEAVPEILRVKQEIFGKLSEFTASHTVYASNTGSLPVSKIGRLSKRPGKVIGMHHEGFTPVFNTLIEIMGSNKTAKESLELGKAVGESFPSVSGKRLVVCLEKEAAGFIAFRISLPAKYLEIILLDKAREQGITFEQLYAAGYDMRRLDYAGLDTILNGLTSNQENISPDFAPPKFLTELVKQGKLGRKTGRGIYEWDESGNVIIKETQVEEKALNLMKEYTDPELMLAARMNEACRLLELGAVKGYEVINEVERISESHEGIFVLGWDKYKEWAEKLERLAEKIGKPYFKPCEMMRSGRFKDYQAA